MRIRAYFAALGERAPIEAIGEQAALEGSLIKELGTKRPAEHKQIEPSRWMWRTERISIGSESIEADIERFVLGLLQLSAAWKSALASSEERVLTLIVQTEDDEAPCSISLSSRTVNALSLLGGAFDIDHVTMME